ncbi:MAG: sugar porter family MFS transporter [Chthoniobacterales bacterium]|nr:sugar porter family MFS transporter [Chthoniobacterales bacterium]
MPPTAAQPAGPRGKIKPIVYFIGLTAALAGLLFGLDVGVISGANEFIQKDFKIDDAQIERIVSSLLWGAVFGVVLSGIFSLRLGRRGTILISAMIFAAGSVLCALAPTPGALIAARFFLGIAVGMASFVAPLYLSEIAPRSVRGALISMYQLMITIGIVVAFLSDTFFATYANLEPLATDISKSVSALAGGRGQMVIEAYIAMPWRWMLGSIAVPALLMFVGMLFLPESPRWLVLKKRIGEARNVLRRLATNDADAGRELEDIQSGLLVEQKGFALFRDNADFRRSVFLGVGLQVIQQFTGINVVMYYAPRILQEAGFTTTAEQMWGTVLVGTINVLATFIAIAFVDRLGRKPIMFTGFAVMGAGMISLGALFHLGLGGEHHGMAMSYLAIGALIVFIIGFAMSAGPIIWIICCEIYPLAGRDFGITCSTVTNWAANAVVGMTFLSMLNGLGPGNTFLLYGAMNAAFIAFFILFVPETKGVSLESIEKKLLGGARLREIGK